MPRLVRFVFINNHCITDPTAGVTRSLWTMLRWLADADHQVHVLTTARFESPVPFSLVDHLASLKVRLKTDSVGKIKSRRLSHRSDRRVTRFRRHGVHVSLLHTRSTMESQPDAIEQKQYLKLFAKLLSDHSPEVVIAANGHPMIREALATAKAAGVTTTFAVRGFGFDRAEYFADVDHVFTCSQFLSDRFHDETGLSSTPLDPPLVWSEIVAAQRDRKFLGFVNPSPHKGAMWFAGLAQMLGEKRADIPIMVVQSGRSAELLNSIPGVDFSRFPQIMAAPPVDTPREYFALTRVLLVPSVWEEPFGRVAAESMVNGIPAIVSDRGALPSVVGGDFTDGGGGLVRTIPANFTKHTTTLPSTTDLQPWFDAVTQLWDDDTFFARIADCAKKLAAARYAEEVLRDKHLDYFTSLDSC